MAIFNRTNILLPKGELLDYWPVIACDQFTSQSEYWDMVRDTVKGHPSTYDLIYPEAEMAGGHGERGEQDGGHGDCGEHGERDDEHGGRHGGQEVQDARHYEVYDNECGKRNDRIDTIQKNMNDYLAGGVLREYPDSYVYVERTLKSGSIRKGIVGVIDLEAYDYHHDSTSPIRPTEKTILERIPPRVKIRKGAPIELSHVILLCDDADKVLIESVAAGKDSLEQLYSIDLMQGGGHVSGWLLTGGAADRFDDAMRQYLRRQEEKGSSIMFAVGDGNHSLAAAKECWEDLKKANPGIKTHPARYAMVELENLQDEAQHFERINRVVKGVDTDDLLSRIKSICVDDPGSHSSAAHANKDTAGQSSFDKSERADAGCPIHWSTKSGEGEINLDLSGGQLPVAVLQRFLDEYIAGHGGLIDYIHGTKIAASLAREDRAIAFILPWINKDDLFANIDKEGSMPRKAFSVGHAEEKRYYLECRKIVD